MPLLPTTNEDLGFDWDNPSTKTGIKQSVIDDPTNDYKYNKADSEYVITNDNNRQNNTWIVLGRDRPGGWDSGYGSKGHLRAGAIDIVAGRLSSVDARTVTGLVNPNFGADAARIYISQKTDVDLNFGIQGVDGTDPSIAQSAIAIKADAVRIIARESLKLVTHTDALLSTGVDAYKADGVKLICQTGEETPSVQPIPLGDNLVKAFDELIKLITQFNGYVVNFLDTQQKFNQELANHTHYESFFAQKTTIDPNVAVQHQSTLLQQFLNVRSALKGNVWNLNNIWKNRYIVPMSVPDGAYILSKFHKLN
jgi:hypothetical protein